MKLSYQACDPSGKVVADTIEAADSAEAIERLRREGLFVTQITPVSEGQARQATNRSKSIGKSRNTKKNLMLLTRQLYLLLSTGTPVVQALESLSRQTQDPAWNRVIGLVQKGVEDGSSLSEAMSQYPAFFDPIYCSLIGAGESSGKLAYMLDRLANLLRKQVQVRNAVVGALIYPCLLIALAVVVMVIMLTVVLPRFEELFSKLDAPLPPSTKLLMTLSASVRTNGWVILIGLVVAGVVVRAWLKTALGQRTVDSVVLKLPQMGRIIRSFTTAKLARLLGILLDSHLPLIEVLNLIRHTVRNHHYTQLIQRAEESVMRGDPVSAAFARSDLIPATVTEAMRSGEQTGRMASSLLTIADYMDEENDVVVRSLTSILEPLILIGLGILVGFMAVSMFLPLFDMTSLGG